MRSILPLFIACILTMLPYAAAFAGESATLVREEQKIIIDGVEERWRLVWESKPEPVCAANEADWMTCPCMGFAFGETGNLTLVRERNKKVIERLSLDQFFTLGETPSAKAGSILRRWDVHEKDLENSEKPGFSEQIKSRPIVKIMRLADYDHDGRATEFILQIGNLPCGKRTSVVIGVSKRNPHLHAFNSIKNPAQPLILMYSQWQSLQKEKANGSVKAINWPCGDHGAETQEELDLRAVKGKISATRRVYECTDHGIGKMIKKEEF